MGGVVVHSGSPLLIPSASFREALDGFVVGYDADDFGLGHHRFDEFLLDGDIILVRVMSHRDVTLG